MMQQGGALLPWRPAVAVNALLGDARGAIVFLVGWVVTRWMMLHNPPDVGDVQWYFRIADAWFSGSVPYRDEPFEYPPGIIALALPLRWLAHDLAAFAKLFAFLMFAADMLNVALLFVLARHLRVDGGRPSRWWEQGWFIGLFYAGLSALLGRMLIQRYDVVLGSVFLGFLCAAVQDRRRLAVFLLALGFWLKGWPVILLPLYLVYVWHGDGAAPRDVRAFLRWLVRTGWRLPALFGVTAALLYAPFLVVAGADVFAFARYQGERGLHVESTLAAFVVLFGDGARTQPSHRAAELVHTWAPALATVAPLFACVLVGAVAWLAHRAWIRSDDLQERGRVLVRSATASVLLLFATWNVASPQFLLWFAAPAAALSFCVVPFRHYRWLGLLTIHVITSLIVFAFYPSLLNAGLAPALLLALRGALVLLLAADLAVSRNAPVTEAVLGTPWRAVEIAGFGALGGLSLVVLGVARDTIPGLHGDEAWVMLNAHAMATTDLRPINGMTPYAGPLHLYVLWPVLQAFGFKLSVLRAFSACTNTLALLACAWLARTLFARSLVWLLLGGLVLTSPFFVMESRYVTEVTSLVPLLLLGGLSLSVHAAVRRHQDPTQGWLGGLLLGLAVYTHVVTVVFVGAVVLGLLAAYRPRALRSRTFLVACTGMLVGVVPRLVAMVKDAGGVRGTAEWALASPRLEDLPNLLLVFADIWDGRILYLRFTGEILWPMLPHATCALVAVFVVRGVFARRHPLTAIELAAYVAFVASIALVAIVVPRYSLRYFMYGAWCACFAMAAAAFALERSGVPRASRIVATLLAGLVVVNTGYVAANYFHAFSESGGKSTVFPVGRRLAETSNHFMRSDVLHRQLREQGAELVVAKDFIVLAMAAYDIGQAMPLRYVVMPLSQFPDRPVDIGPRRAVLVFYNGDEVELGPAAPDYQRQRTLEALGSRFIRDDGFDPHFIVFRNFGNP